MDTVGLCVPTKQIWVFSMFNASNVSRLALLKIPVLKFYMCFLIETLFPSRMQLSFLILEMYFSIIFCKRQCFVMATVYTIRGTNTPHVSA
jgi:hypothetical protein